MPPTTQGRLPFTGASVVAGLEAAVGTLFVVLLDTPPGTRDLGIESDAVGRTGRAKCVLGLVLAS